MGVDNGMEAVECGRARESQANNFKSPSALPAGPIVLSRGSGGDGYGPN